MPKDASSTVVVHEFDVTQFVKDWITAVDLERPEGCWTIRQCLRRFLGYQPVDLRTLAAVRWLKNEFSKRTSDALDLTNNHHADHCRAYALVMQVLRDVDWRSVAVSLLPELAPQVLAVPTL